MRKVPAWQVVLLAMAHFVLVFVLVGGAVGALVAIGGGYASVLAAAGRGALIGGEAWVGSTIAIVAIALTVPILARTRLAAVVAAQDAGPRADEHRSQRALVDALARLGVHSDALDDHGRAALRDLVAWSVDWRHAEPDFQSLSRDLALVADLPARAAAMHNADGRLAAMTEASVSLGLIRDAASGAIAVHEAAALDQARTVAGFVRARHGGVVP